MVELSFERKSTQFSLYIKGYRKKNPGTGRAKKDSRTREENERQRKSEENKGVSWAQHLMFVLCKLWHGKLARDNGGDGE